MRIVNGFIREQDDFEWAKDWLNDMDDIESYEGVKVKSASGVIYTITKMGDTYDFVPRRGLLPVTVRMKTMEDLISNMNKFRFEFIDKTLNEWEEDWEWAKDDDSKAKYDNKYLRLLSGTIYKLRYMGERLYDIYHMDGSLFHSDIDVSQIESGLSHRWRIVPNPINEEEDDLFNWDWAAEVTTAVTHDNAYEGMRVTLKSNSRFKHQSSGVGTIHTVDKYQHIDPYNNDQPCYWVQVKWNHGSLNSYRIGPSDYDLLMYHNTINESNEWDEDWDWTSPPYPDGVRFYHIGDPKQVYTIHWDGKSRHVMVTWGEISKTDDGARYNLMDVDYHFDTGEWIAIKDTVNEEIDDFNDFDWAHDIPAAPEPLTHKMVKIGIRVMIRKDTRYDLTNMVTNPSNTPGTIIIIYSEDDGYAHTHLDNLYIRVRWDNHTTNGYHHTDLNIVDM